MSLNGLDEVPVREAYETAVAEPGGWFLLKYASRDEVDLLSRGTGGIVEMRNKIAQYEESSPLFGFLRYRRRSVIIKYLPEDCSRLVQARVTVHFNAVCEKFAPYNTTFSIANAKELKDTKLSAACSLHAASGSTSSSTSSLRRRRLMEIAEEEEEEQRERKRQSTVLEDRPGQENHAEALAPPASPTSPPVTLNSQLALSPEESRFAQSSEQPDFVGAARPSSPTESIDNGRRMSSQTARPELYSHSSYTYGKPKVKLGPRPSLDVSGRPKTAGTFRPVSQIPAGFKMNSKGSKRVKTQDGQGVDESPEDGNEPSDITFVPTSIPLPDAPPIPLVEESSRSYNFSGRPATSSGASMKKSPVHSTFSSAAKQKMTPEKARLMRAMQLREKKKHNNKAAAGDPLSSPAEESTDTTPMPATNAPPTSEDDFAATKEDENPATTSEQDPHVIADASCDSLPTDPSDSTRSDSRPASPLLHSSEPDHSTKASSLSDSTDETVKEPPTVQEAQENKQEETKGDKETTLVPSAESEVAGGISTQPNADVEEGAGAVPDQAQENSELEQIKPELDPAKPADLHALDETETQDSDAMSPHERLLPTFAANRQSAGSIDSAPEVIEDTQSSAVQEPPKTPVSPPRSPGLPIPKSKFSTQDMGSPTSRALGLSNIASSPPSSTLEQLGSSPLRNEDVLDATPPPPKPSKRRAVIEPIRTNFDMQEKRSDAHLSDDEDLMDELQSATVEQAQHMLVSKSPITPVFPSPSKQSTQDAADSTLGSATPRNMTRTISNPVRPSLLTPADISQNSARSVSSGAAAYLHKITQQSSSNQNLASKSGKLGSNISQRIKALEMLSTTKEGSSKASGPSATFFSVRKASTREPSRSPSVAERASSFSRASPPRTAISESRDASPEVKTPRERSGSVASRLSVFEVPEVPPVSTMPRGRPESISVTARIIRDPSRAGSTTDAGHLDASEYKRLDLKVSPLEVNHQKAEPAVPEVSVHREAATPRETIQERRMSREKRRSQSGDRGDEQYDSKARRSSLSIVRDFIKDRRKSLTSASTDALAVGSPMSSMSANASPSRPPSTHQNSFPRRLSISSRRSSISKDAGGAGIMSPSMFTEASGSGDDSKSTNSDKKKSRAGRFMRRLSSSFGAGRGKNMTPTAISPTVQEEELSEGTDFRGVSRGGSIQQSSIVAYMGDVNVQFPDNLLWKRRTMCLDSQGFLILSAAAASTAHKDRPAGAGVKRYHLSDFRKPYTPDVEVQELPNSVVLDLVDGSGLQIACEDRAGQLNVLHILQDAHGNHTSFGQ